ncbi:hypothetical protein C8A01DRAFT_15512 [Parachaetomium inaequale]|uniref:LYR motif-containing protein Cup1-like N-terminal domain-containing protein n=1 Tax=Parachaetomium inaequale TaxID=2588326 RepID=A0AAN6PGQ7_9PEZI|nr:hypothetical protein C8A01DRAFT_15512 [Parachaetomium inaequale]
MSRPLRIPKPQTPLHLYRHLLRETSYLPPLARPSVHKQIRNRFERDSGYDQDKNPKHIRQGHHELRALRAANSGDLVRMRRVLLRAFGRIGRRRRELVSHLVQRDTPTNTEELAKYAEALAGNYKNLDWLDEWDVEKLRMYARSQLQAGLNNPPKAPITDNQTAPEKILPTENAWGRPLPKKLARTKLKKMWKSLAEKIMPPLPKKEWETLKAIVQGTVQGPWLPPPRRPLARGMSENAQPQEGQAWAWQSYAIKPVAVVDLPTNRKNKLLSGAVDDNTPTGDPDPVGCHKYTPRAWRRMLGTIWQLSATMTKKPEGDGSCITWGKQLHQPLSANAGNMEFFTDFPDVEAPKVEDKGRRSRNPKPEAKVEG